MENILVCLLVATPSAAPLKVIGLGYGRTGTESLLTALIELGFGPTYHVKELILEEQDVPKVI